MMIKLLGRRVRCDCINYYEYLTDEMIDKYEEAFRQADIGGSGSLTRDEWAGLFIGPRGVGGRRFSGRLVAQRLDGAFSAVQKADFVKKTYHLDKNIMTKAFGIRLFKNVTLVGCLKNEFEPEECGSAFCKKANCSA